LEHAEISVTIDIDLLMALSELNPYYSPPLCSALRLQ
jgi:hypothetical protein